MAFNALEAGLSSFAVFTLGIDPGTASIFAGAVSVTFIIAAMPAGFLGTKYGRGPVIRMGLIALTLIFLISYFIIQDPITFVAALVLTGIFWAFVNVNSLPLVYDHGDERRIGAYTGLYYFSSQSAAVLGPTMGGVMVDLLGDQYRWLFIYGAVFMFLALLAVIRVK
jgi:MFS family permease